MGWAAVTCPAGEARTITEATTLSSFRIGFHPANTTRVEVFRPEPKNMFMFGYLGRLHQTSAVNRSGEYRP